MTFISKFSIEAEKKRPFPFNVQAIQYSKNVDLSNPINFFIGDNGTGKSTLLESIAFRLQLPHLDGSDYSKKSFNAARSLMPFFKLEWRIERSIGFFFRAEDFGDLMNSVHRNDVALHNSLNSLVGEVPDNIIQQMKDSANSQLHHVRRNYGQDLDSFSHGEAYLQILKEKINNRGIYILDEPEAALSPSRQLSLIYFIMEHLERHNSQFIIATHSPMLMAYPEATIYEITESGMEVTPLEETEHYFLTKSFLSNPEIYFRDL